MSTQRVFFFFFFIAATVYQARHVDKLSFLELRRGNNANNSLK